MERKNGTFTLIFTNFIAAMGITIVVPLIGNASQIFGVSQASGIWIITAFMLTYAVGMPLTGKISDSMGRKPIYILFMSLFSVGLLISAVSSNFTLIVIGRLIQGFGASGTLPISNAMAFELFGSAKGRIIGFISAAFGMGSIAGINLGGFVYSLFGWRTIFVAMFAISLVGLLLSFGLPESLKEKKKSRIDLFGTLTFASTMVFFMLLFKALGKNSVFSAEVLPYLVLFLISAVAFSISEMTVKNPIVDVKLFKNPTFSLTIAVALLGGTGMFIAMTIIPSFAQILLGYSVSNASYSVDPMAAVLIIFSAITGLWIDKRGSEEVLLFGVAVLTGAFYLLARFSNGPLTYYLFTMTIGVGLGSIIAPMTYLAIKEAGSGNAGVSSGMASLFRTIGGIVGPTVAGYILSQTDFESLFAMENILKSYSKIFYFGFWSLVIATVLAAVIFFKGRRGRKLIK